MDFKIDLMFYTKTYGQPEGKSAHLPALTVANAVTRSLD